MKIGDKVKRLHYAHADMKVGDIGTIEGFAPMFGDMNVIIKEFKGLDNDYTHDPIHLKLVKENKMEKKFKNKLAVSGSVSLREAFTKELEQLGYKVESEYPSTNKYTTCVQVNQVGGNGIFANTSNKIHGGYDVIELNLPQDWDKALQLACEVVEEPKFKEGDWCYIKPFSTEYLFKFKFSNEHKVVTDEYYAIDSKSNIIHFADQSNYISSIEDIRLATDKEIERILVKVAQIKYPIGTKVIGIETTEIKANVNCGKEAKIIGFRYYTADGVTHSIYDSSNTFLYNSGVWAEIIVKEDLKVNGYNVTKVNEEEVKVGCRRFIKDDLENLKAFLSVYGGTYNYDGFEWNPDEIKEVLTVFD